MSPDEVQTAQMQAAVVAFLAGYRTTAERVQAVEAALAGKLGKLFRARLGKWIVRLVPVDVLVPDPNRQWRPLVRDAMLFVVSRLSAARLAPKIVEQLELPPDTTAEARLLRLIARVPGLQKIGQVLARNRNLHPALRRALSELENGISDVGIDEIRKLIFEQLGPQIAGYAVKVRSAIYSEASVSAVVQFTWRNPDTRRRERGVFKVMKPHIPDCYSEDMQILQRLAGHLARKHRGGRISLAQVAETLAEIRLLLEREVDFRREQLTILQALRVYRAMPGIRIPRLILPLSTATITALSEEKGVKVTDALARRHAMRARVAERLAEALVAVPALAPDDETIFHADPHAGNVLYDTATAELVILDWALTGRLTREQRKRVLLLVMMTMLRDAGGICSAIDHLRRSGGADEHRQSRIVRECVRDLLDSLPVFHIPRAMDAMQLLHDIAMEGVRFPGALLMFRKATFTLDGVLEDIAGSPVRMDAVVGRYALGHVFDAAATLWWLLSPADWIALDWSVLTFGSRLWLHSMLRPWRWFSGAMRVATLREVPAPKQQLHAARAA